VLAAGLLASTAVPAAAQGTRGDPLESINRAIFRFNDVLDVYLLEPIATGYDFVVPDPAQRSVDRFFTNLRFPIVFVNSLLQGKPVGASNAFGRFTINTLLGAGGLLDPATSVGIPAEEEDFGQTLGRWGLGPGAYLVLPLLGPSSIRDGVGLAVDAPLRVWPYFLDAEIVWSAYALQAVNTRSLFLDEVEMAKRDSLDYYAAIRDAYLQHRAALVDDRRSSPDEAEPSDEDLYYPDVE
jgi:phospholipid-binding lipoprotein MlaA